MRISAIAEPRITPFLMLNANPAEAARFYVSIFENSKIQSADPMQATFVLDGQKFHAFNGGERFTSSEGTSFFVSCTTQQEVDHYWNNLTADGGSESMCGWLKDKYGIFWQVIPTILMDLLGNKDRELANRAMQAMLKMRKVVIEELEAAAAGK